MSWTKEVWRREVAMNLFEMSSIKFQRDIWLNKIPGYQSDFTELVNNFESCGIPEYLNDFVKDLFLDNNEAKVLFELSELLENTGNYETEYDYNQLWCSEDWLIISSLASKAFKGYFEQDLLNDSKSEYHKWKIAYSIYD